MSCMCAHCLSLSFKGKLCVNLGREFLVNQYILTREPLDDQDIVPNYLPTHPGDNNPLHLRVIHYITRHHMGEEGQKLGESAKAIKRNSKWDDRSSILFNVYYKTCKKSGALMVKLQPPTLSNTPHECPFLNYRVYSLRHLFCFSELSVNNDNFKCVIYISFFFFCKG